MGNNLSLAAGGGGGGSSTPSSPDDDTQSFHTAEDDTTNNNNINSDQNHNNTTASIDACNKIIAATQNATPSSPPKHITLQDSYSSTSSSNINDDKNIINNNYDNNLINTHNKKICYDMLSDNSITKTAEQKKNSKALTSVISDWMSNPSTKEKYMKHEWRQEDFTNSEVNDILESLMESSNTSPGHADFMDSSYYQSMKKHLNVIQHDYGDGGDKKFVLFETKDIAQRVELAGLMFDDEEGDNKNAVQINCDLFIIIN